MRQAGECKRRLGAGLRAGKRGPALEPATGDPIYAVSVSKCAYAASPACGRNPTHSRPAGTIEGTLHPDARTVASKGRPSDTPPIAKAAPDAPPLRLHPEERQAKSRV